MRALAVVITDKALAAIAVGFTTRLRRATAPVPAPFTFPGEPVADAVGVIAAAFAVGVALVTDRLTGREDFIYAASRQETTDADSSSRLEESPPPGAGRAQSKE